MVERFTMHGAEGGGYSWKINQWGNWVRSSDYDKVAEENRELRVYTQEATRAITGLTAGGSEFFGKKIGDIYTADLQFCTEHIRERFKGAMDARLENAKLQRENRDLRAKMETVEAETLPCDVMVAPRTTITKGCSVATLMLAISKRKGWPDENTRFPGTPLTRSLKDKDQQNG